MSFIGLFRTLIILLLLILFIIVCWLLGLNHYRDPNKSVEYPMVSRYLDAARSKQILPLWDRGYDTLDIALILDAPESVIYNRLTPLRLSRRRELASYIATQLGPYTCE